MAAAWRANLDANLLSAVLTTTAVLGRLRAGGSIINVGSIGAEYASTSYGAAEGGAGGVDGGPCPPRWARQGLTANVISPGYIAETDFFRGRLTEERKARLIEATHDGRAGRPGDIAETAYFLASAGARHITGQTLHVNGGAQHRTTVDSATNRERRGHGHHPQDDVDPDQAGAAGRLAARLSPGTPIAGARRTWPRRAGSGSTTRRARSGSSSWW